MTVYGGFSAPTLGMLAQSHAINVIGVNIANVNTGGFKRTDTQFQTVLSNTYFNQSDIGGLKPKDAQAIDSPGNVQASDNSLYAAINGKGFFVMNTAIDGSGETFYGRDGAFQMATNGTSTVAGNGGETITVKNGYLADKNGYYVMGWAADPTTGLFDTSGTPTAMRIDAYTFNDAFEPTATAKAALNLPSTAQPGHVETFSASMYDSAGVEQSAFLTFTRDTALRTWNLSIGTSNAGDTVTSAAVPVTFDVNGKIAAPTSYTAEVTWASGATSSVAIDLSEVIQYGGQYEPINYSKSGYGKSDLTNVYYDSEGYVNGDFQDNSSRRLYRLPIAVFTNPNALAAHNGNVYEATEEAGVVKITTPGDGGYGSIMPNAHELSNVDMAAEFSRMIMVQNAYNSSATAFKTTDEMLVTAGELKR